MADDFEQLRKKLIAETKLKVRGSVGKDNLIMQASSSIEEADKAANMLAKRLREWYSFYLPEFSNSISSHEKFAELIQKKNKSELLKEIGVLESETMGAEISKQDLDAILELANALERLYRMKESQSKYLDAAMKSFCPNITAVAGSLIGAKLISLAGGIARLSRFPSSTIQLLGAEKALFRHLKTGAKSPKHGIIHEHPLIQGAKISEHGKIARLLADKIAIAAKVDFFRGKFVGDELNDQIKRRLKE